MASESAELSINETVRPTAKPRRAIGLWLLVVAGLVFAMVMLGGYTRLTHSGLSMVDWRPVTGWLPPLDAAAWQSAFDAYKQYPEYQKINQGMDLAGFKGIFWAEYLHRLLGRLIGLAFFLPFLFFLVRGYLSDGLVWRTLGLLVLGGSQGVLGWFMVKSGLVDHPDVSHYRLTAHLGLAVIIYGCLLWVAFDLLGPRQTGAGAARLWRPATLTVFVLFIQMLLGGLVAGLDAGRAYNTFPDMNGEWLPAGLLVIEPVWRNLFDNALTVQFDHRAGAYLVTLLVLFLWWRGRGVAGLSNASYLLMIALWLQFGLGVGVLLAGVPVGLGVLHQAFALVLFTAAVRFLWLVRPAKPQSEVTP